MGIINNKTIVTATFLLWTVSQTISRNMFWSASPHFFLSPTNCLYLPNLPEDRLAVHSGRIQISKEEEGEKFGHTSQSSVKLGFKNVSWKGGLKYVRQGADFCCLNQGRTHLIIIWKVLWWLFFSFPKKNSWLWFPFDLP